MSKHPSPRLDQLRALREAKYARKNVQPQPAAIAPKEPAPAEPTKRAPKKAKAKKKAAAKR